MEKIDKYIKTMIQGLSLNLHIRLYCQGWLDGYLGKYPSEKSGYYDTGWLCGTETKETGKLVRKPMAEW